MQEFRIRANEYLGAETRGFFFVPYLRFRQPGNPDYLNTLKNTFNNKAVTELGDAAGSLRTVLMTAFPQIRRALGLRIATVCVVPRAKADLDRNQLLFKETVRTVVSSLDGFVDGTDYVSRHTNTRTTHLVGAEDRMPNYVNDGPMPYVGITRRTCRLAQDIRDKDILLVDDIYTPRVNIDEDAIQALLDMGARSVAFYAVAKAGAGQI